MIFSKIKDTKEKVIEQYTVPKTVTKTFDSKEIEDLLMQYAKQMYPDAANVSVKRDRSYVNRTSVYDPAEYIYSIVVKYKEK